MQWTCSVPGSPKVQHTSPSAAQFSDPDSAVETGQLALDQAAVEEAGVDVIGVVVMSGG